MTDALNTRQRNALAGDNRAALAEAIEAERQRLVEAERDPAAEARANIAELEAAIARDERLDAERAAEQEQLAGRWTELRHELAGVVARAVEIGAEMSQLNDRDIGLTSLRAATAGDNPAVARYSLRRLQCRLGHAIDMRQLRHLASQVEALELASDRPAPESFIVSRPEPEPPPHFPAGGEPNGRCLNDGEWWPCATAQEARADKERSELRWARS
jgi:hypothetical protein